MRSWMWFRDKTQPKYWKEQTRKSTCCKSGLCCCAQNCLWFPPERGGMLRRVLWPCCCTCWRRCTYFSRWSGAISVLPRNWPIHDGGHHWQYENQSTHTSPVHIHLWLLLVPRVVETMCYISCEISKIVSSTLSQPNIVDKCSVDSKMQRTAYQCCEHQDLIVPRRQDY